MTRRFQPKRAILSSDASDSSDAADPSGTVSTADPSDASESSNVSDDPSDADAYDPCVDKSCGETCGSARQMTMIV